MDCVYRYVGTTPVYVGKTKNILARHAQHMSDSWYWPELRLDVIWCESPADADILETYFIGVYSNKYYGLRNIRKKFGSIIPKMIDASIEEKWIVFDTGSKAPPLRRGPNECAHVLTQYEVKRRIGILTHVYIETIPLNKIYDFVGCYGILSESDFRAVDVTLCGMWQFLSNGKMERMMFCEDQVYHKIYLWDEYWKTWRVWSKCPDISDLTLTSKLGG